MIEMKFGRPVIAGETDIMAGETDIKGTYIHKSSGNAHAVLCDDNVIRWFDNVKPDPDGAPMNGDEVEGSENGNTYTRATYRYIGRRADGFHEVEKEGKKMFWRYVRHPQPSKRERLLDLIDKWDVDSDSELVDEILKICEVKE